MFNKVQNIKDNEGGGCTSQCLLDYSYFKEHYKLTVIDLSKQQALDGDPSKYNKLIKMDMKRKIQQSSSLFVRNRETIVNIFCFDIISL